MIRRVLAVVVVLLVLIGLLGAVGGLARKSPVALAAPSGTVVLSVGQVETVRCPAGQETVQFATGPAVIRCNPKGSPTTTTVPSSTTTTTGRTTTTTLATTTTTRASTTTTTSGTTTSTSAGPSNGTPASLMPDSIFNQPVTGDAVLSNSAAIVSSLDAQAASVYSGNWVVNGDGTYGRPIYEAAANAPQVPLIYGSYCPSWAGSGWLSQVGPTIPAPPGATPSSSSDQIIAIYSPSMNRAWELWDASYGASGWSACNAGELTLSSTDGVFPAPSGESASGIANLATEVSDADVASGSIDHAIAIQSVLTYCEWVGSDGGLPPADRSDCNGPGPVAEGMYFRFAPGTVCGSACNNAFAEMVFQAGLKYGFVDTDQGGTVAVLADTGVSSSAAFGGAQEYEAIAPLPWTDLQAIAPPQ